MPEPITVIAIGALIWGMSKSKQPPGSGAPGTSEGQALIESPAAATAAAIPISADASGTGPDAPMATNTSVANQAAGVTLATSPQATVIPSDLVAALDNETALYMRAYAALNPEDFQAFLDRYANRVVLRNDLFFERVTADPTAPPIEPSPQMLVSMGSAAYRVAQALNGVAVGKSVDVFGIAASAAGQIPGLSKDLVTGLQAAALAYRAITGITDIMTVAAAYPTVSVMELGGLMAGGVTAYPGLAALPLAGVLMAVGLVVDIGFTIIGDKPDLQKAIDVALDVASLAVLFIPVIGVVIAIVIQLVKFIIDLFGDDLFGGGMSHEQREILETARYGENLNPMFPQLADSYTPRELFRTIIAWGSGYCGGFHVVAMSVNLVLRAGDQLLVGGEVYTVPEDMLLGFGDNDQAGGCYWLATTPFARITNDEQALALARFAPVNGVVAMAQAGISDWRKAQFNDPTEKLIMARATPMRDFVDTYHLSLDQIDQIALEYRAQPHLLALATSFGWATWQEMFSEVVAAEWATFIFSVAHATLTDFARQHGYPTMYAFRAAALASYERYYARVQQASGRLYQNTLDAQRQQLEAQMLAQQQWSMSAP
jgi:hypothetical protein